jgi:hypothetical protein
MTREHPPVSSPGVGTGDVLAGRYELLRSVGDESDAFVFEAHDQRGDEPVRITIGRRRGDKRGVAQLEKGLREARALGHPGALRPRELGLTTDGHVYVVSDAVEGPVLQAWLDTQPPLPPARAARLVASVLEVLQAAHARGLVHGVLKPCRLVLSQAGEPDEHLRVMDLGAAGAITGDLGAGNLTSSIHLGMPTYTAPELLVGAPATPAADVYSAALLLAAMRLGRPVVDEPTVARALARQLSLDAEAVAAELGGEPLAEVVRRGLRREPEARYADAGAMLVALREAVPEAFPRAEKAEPRREIPSVVVAEEEGATAFEEWEGEEPTEPVGPVESPSVAAGATAVAAAGEPVPMAAIAAAKRLGEEPRRGAAAVEGAVEREESLLLGEGVPLTTKRGRTWLFVVLLLILAVAVAALLYFVFWPPGRGREEVGAAGAGAPEDYELVVVEGSPSLAPDPAGERSRAETAAPEPAPRSASVAEGTGADAEGTGSPAEGTGAPAEGTGAADEGTGEDAEGREEDGAGATGVDESGSRLEPPARDDAVLGRAELASPSDDSAANRPGPERLRPDGPREAIAAGEPPLVQEDVPPAASDPRAPADSGAELAPTGLAGNALALARTEVEGASERALGAPGPATVARHRARVRLTSEPSGARLRIGEQELGRTPYEGVIEADAEQVVVTVAKRGHRLGRETLRLNAGALQRHVVLQPLGVEGGEDVNPFGTVNRLGGD